LQKLLPLALKNDGNAFCRVIFLLCAIPHLLLSPLRFSPAAAAIASMLLNSVYACAAAQPAGSAQRVIEVPFSRVENGVTSGIGERKFVVIKTAKEWADLWQAHASLRIPAPPLPAVDFKREMIVAVFAGEKRSGGYGIEIAKIAEDTVKGQLVISFRETQPPPGSMTPQALTQPFDIVRINRIEVPATFVPEP